MRCFTIPSANVWTSLAYLLVGLSLGSASQWIPGQSVQTTSGTVKGHAAPYRKDVSEYLGIPYAHPAVGELRFAAPVRYAGNQTIDASKFSPACPHLVSHKRPVPQWLPNAEKILSSAAGVGLPQGEDCLTLNVWTKPQTGEQKKAIYVWIYGGAFKSGQTGNPAYNGQFIADESDVVMVTINYRTNIFGFLGLPGFEQNAGLLDQRMAVEWVRDNAEAFGGDPTRIVIGGQSAGAGSVDYYAYAWIDDPIVAGFIMESGTAVSRSGLPSNEIAAWFNLTTTLGCGGAGKGAEATIRCVRAKPVGEILAAIPPGGPVGPFQPTVDNKTVFGNYEEREIEGQFVHKPFLIGNNNYEAGLFEAAYLEQNITYPQIYWYLANFRVWTCPTRDAALARAHQKVPVWRYRYFGDFPNLRLVPKSGAYHSEEISVYFGTSQLLSGASPDPYQLQYAQYMRNAWTSFVKDPQNGLLNLGWPTFDSNAASLIRLAYNNREVKASTVDPWRYDYICPKLDQILASMNSNATTNATCGRESHGDESAYVACLAEHLPTSIRQLLANSTAEGPIRNTNTTTSVYIPSFNSHTHRGGKESGASSARMGRRERVTALMSSVLSMFMLR